MGGAGDPAGAAHEGPEPGPGRQWSRRRRGRQPSAEAPSLGFWGQNCGTCLRASCPQQTSSLFLCLVMDYSKGDLQKVIERNREKRVIMDSEVRRTVQDTRPGDHLTM